MYHQLNMEDIFKITCHDCWISYCQRCNVSSRTHFARQPYSIIALSTLYQLTSALSRVDSPGSLVMRYVFETGSTTHSRPRLTAA